MRAVIAALLVLGACGSTATKTVTVPGPTVTVTVPGPTVTQLPDGCGQALADWEKAINAFRKEVATVIKGRDDPAVSAVDYGIQLKTLSDLGDTLNAADGTATEKCFKTS